MTQGKSSLILVPYVNDIMFKILFKCAIPIRFVHFHCFKEFYKIITVVYSGIWTQIIVK